MDNPCKSCQSVDMLLIAWPMSKPSSLSDVAGCACSRIATVRDDPSTGAPRESASASLPVPWPCSRMPSLSARTPSASSAPSAPSASSASASGSSSKLPRSLLASSAAEAGKGSPQMSSPVLVARS